MKVDAVAERKQKGLGATLQFVIDPIIEFGVSAAIGTQKDQTRSPRRCRQTCTPRRVSAACGFQARGFIMHWLASNWIR